MSTRDRFFFLLLPLVVGCGDGRRPVRVAGSTRAPRVTEAAAQKFVGLPPNATADAPLMFVVQYGDMQRPGPSWFLMRFQPGVHVGMHHHAHDYHAVVVSGRPHHWSRGAPESPALAPGSTWFQPALDVHDDWCEGPEPCVLFIAYSDVPTDITKDESP